MKKYVYISVFISVIFTGGFFGITYAEKCSSVELCDYYEEQLEIYEEKMRRGYPARQYNYLSGKVRYYKDKIYDECRCHN